MEQQQQTKTPTQQKGAAKSISPLEGVSGRLRIDVPGAAPRVFEVKGGAVQPVEANGAADTRIAFDGESTFVDVFTGKKNPFVMSLQGRVQVEGNLVLAAKVLMAMHAQGSMANQPSATEVRS
jgi:putative sterol carrier protein